MYNQKLLRLTAKQKPAITKTNEELSGAGYRCHYDVHWISEVLDVI